MITTSEILDTVEKTSPNLPWVRKGLLYHVQHGSRAYNTNFEDSDYDSKGVVCPPKEYFLGYSQNFEQIELKSPNPDCTIYDLVKFFRLAATSANPNLIEMLFVKPEHHLFVSPVWEQVLDNRDLFLTKKIRYSMGGFAFANWKRAKKHFEWLKHPPGSLPTRKALGLPEKPELGKEKTDFLFSMVEKEIEGHNFNFLQNITKDERYALKEMMSSMIDGFEKWEAGEKFEFYSRKLGVDDNVIEILQQERAYRNQLADYKRYQTWLSERNEERAKLEAKHGFDCYSADTEFLTDSGWKLFDEISEKDKLATACIRLHEDGKPILTRPFLSVEYENYVDKFDSLYSGPMYNLHGNFVDSMVTSNHRMLVQPLGNHAKEKFEKDWKFVEASMLKGHFNVVRAITPKPTTYCNKQYFGDLPISEEDYLKLMGWYLSDGTMEFRGDKPKSIRISQILNGKLSYSMTKWQNSNKNKANSSIYEYVRKSNDFNPREHVEKILSVRNKVIVNKIFQECGGREEKHIPRYIFSLSQRLQKILLQALMLGDGTLIKEKHKNDGYVYYSKHKKLANDVQELGFMCGSETVLRGPYNQSHKGYDLQMYQVFVRENVTQTRELNIGSIAKKDVVGERVVCFTVPNGTLITRRNGYIGVHGNCKSISHVYRLFLCAIETLKTGKLNVFRDDRDLIMWVRNGGPTFDEVEQFVKNSDVVLTELYQSSNALPYTPDHKKIDQLCISIAETTLSTGESS